MLSVIIPTMWKYPPFLKFLNNLTQIDVVSEIILIDNEHDACPTDLLPKSSKIKHYWWDSNIFVNPAWNFGVERSTNENICILNDDVIVDLKLFYDINNFMNNDNQFGTAGICPGLLQYEQPLFINGAIDIIPWDPGLYNNSSAGTRFGFGTLFFVKRKNWIPIPNEMRVYCGDDWVFETQLRQGNINYLITNCFFHTPYAQTTSLFSKEQTNELMCKDIAVYGDAIVKVAIS